MPRPANPDKANYYIDTKELEDEVRKSKEIGHPTDRIKDLFLTLAKRISGCYIYDSNDDRHDCVMNAYVVLLSKYDKFNLDSGKDCFSYYTQIALNGLRAGWNMLNGKRKVTVSLDNIFQDGI